LKHFPIAGALDSTRELVMAPLPYTTRHRLDLAATLPARSAV
jgi:hypothetical protein